MEAKKPRLEEKVSAEDFVGFIHDVSPEKTSASNSKYFDAKMQLGQNEYHRIVVFDSNRRGHFLNAAEAKTPVKVHNARRSISFSDPTGFDITCSKKTIVYPLQATTFKHKAQALAYKTIKQILDEGIENQYVTIEAKVMDFEPQHATLHQIKTSTEPMKLCEVQVADKTGTIKMAVWGPHINLINLGESYKFVNISIRTFDNEKSLSTSPRSVISPITDVGKVTFTKMQTSTTENIEGNVVLCKVTATFMCFGCKAAVQFEKNDKFVKCQHCQMKQLVSNLRRHLSGQITIDADPSKRHKIINEIIHGAFKDVNQEKVLDEDGDSIEEFFLTSKVLLTIKNNNVVGLKIVNISS